ncbi:MAG: hypothetical protein KUL75_05815 [Sterolibacterium sp.]|nr:hypothetical protein [Sterolibacterium sp.]
MGTDTRSDAITFEPAKGDSLLIQGVSASQVTVGGGAIAGGDGNATITLGERSVELLTHQTGLNGNLLNGSIKFADGSVLWTNTGAQTTLTGSNAAGGDLLIAGNNGDTLLGLGGNDLIFGGDGNDNIFGGNGDDLIGGGDGNDVIDGGDGNDTIFASNGNDIITGGNGDDGIDGGDGDDVIDGGDGNDLIIGGKGNDILNGGNGVDTFLYTYAADGEGLDFINDFAAGTGGDVIELSGAPTIDQAWITLHAQAIDLGNGKDNTSIWLADLTETITLVGVKADTLTVDNFLAS